MKKNNLKVTNLQNVGMSSLTHSQASKKLFTNSSKSLFVPIIDYKIDLINVSSKLEILAYIYKLIFVSSEHLSK